VFPVEGARLVTLEDPGGDLGAVAGAYARLRPPEGTTPDAVGQWRERVAKVALAVKVLSASRAADVPDASTRVNAADVVGDLREEATALARENGDERVVAIVAEVLDEVGV